MESNNNAEFPFYKNNYSVFLRAKNNLEKKHFTYNLSIQIRGGYTKGGA